MELGSETDRERRRNILGFGSSCWLDPLKLESLFQIFTHMQIGESGLEITQKQLLMQFFVDEKWRPSYICWKSTTSLTNLDYFEGFKISRTDTLLQRVLDLRVSSTIGKAVNGLRKHGSDKIRQLAKTLIGEWKELVDQWVNTTKQIAGAQGTPESANPSVVDEEEEHEFPSFRTYGHISSRRQGFDSADRWCRRHEP
ncbi:hypothetical protein Rs2_46996 [Raphanus sativus]|nr:hypothetical protein Rs2_46996 [Raphanus sativus]